MSLPFSTAKSFECADLTAACAVSMRMPSSSRRLRAMDSAPSGGTLVSRRSLPTIPGTPCTNGRRRREREAKEGEGRERERTRS